MKKVLLTFIAGLSLLSASAQNSKAVIKSILDNDYPAAAEKFLKIDEEAKSREKYPELYELTRAMLINMPENPEHSARHAYTIFYYAYLDIMPSLEVAKVLKSLKTSLAAVKQQLEDRSVAEVRALDTEEEYRAYLRMAELMDNPYVEELYGELEQRIYADACEKHTIEAYDYYLKCYPESERRPQLIIWRTDLYYQAALESRKELVVEAFVRNNPDYDAEKLERLKVHLSNLQFERVMREQKFDDLKVFSELYPDYPQIGAVMQAMADIEFELLEEDADAMYRFTLRYPDASQTPDLKRRVMAMDALAAVSPSAIFSYVLTYGYDTFYPQFLASLFKYRNCLILTPDLSEVLLVRYCDADGKVGYMNFDGEVVVAPKWESASSPTMSLGKYQRSRAVEVLKERPVAAVRQGGRWGVIDSTGRVVMQPRFLDIDLRNNEILGAIRKDGDKLMPGYYYTRYDLKGKQLAANLKMTLSEEPDGRLPEFASSIKHEITDEGERLLDEQGSLIAATDYAFYYLTPDCARYHSDGENFLVTYHGEVRPIGFVCTQRINDRVVVANRLENMRKKNYFLALDTEEILGECPYREVGEQHNQRILVRTAEGAYGYLDPQLNWVIPATYHTASDFNCGVAAVADATGAFLIDPDADPIQGACYEELIPLVELGGVPGLFLARQQGRYGVVDACGEVVVPIRHEGSDAICVEGCFVRWNAQTKSLLYAPDPEE